MGITSMQRYAHIGHGSKWGWKRMTAKKKQKSGWSNTLPDAMTQAEEYLGPLNVYHFGSVVTTTTLDNKTVTFEKFADGWSWHCAR